MFHYFANPVNIHVLTGGVWEDHMACLSGRSKINKMKLEHLIEISKASVGGDYQVLMGSLKDLGSFQNLDLLDVRLHTFLENDRALEHTILVLEKEINNSASDSDDGIDQLIA